MKVYRDWTAERSLPTVGMVGARVPPSLTSHTDPHFNSGPPRGPVRCQSKRALQKEVDEAGWKTELLRAPLTKELVNVRKGWQWGLTVGSSPLIYMRVPPDLWSSDLGWTHQGTLWKCPHPRLYFSKRHLTKCAKPET